jgi:site-specific DNA recombinase
MQDVRRPVRCAIYTRQSVARPETGGLSSCVVQRELCEEFIAARRMEGWIALPERFDDEGESGSTLERPALDRLLNRIEEGGVDRVIIYRLDRITRSLMDWVKLAETLKRHNVSLSAISGEGLDGADGALVQLMANMIASFAEFERDLISERLRDAKAAKRRRGLRCAGLVPYGLVAAPATRQLTPVPAECEVVCQIFERAAAGATPVEIAGWLNAQRVTTKKTGKVGGRAWTARAVLRVLENRVYVGEIGGTRAAHDPVVAADLFARANAAIGARRTRTPGRRKVEEVLDPFLLRGQIRCVRCGRIMTTASARARTRGIGPLRYYRCRASGSCRGT